MSKLIMIPLMCILLSQYKVIMYNKYYGYCIKYGLAIGKDLTIAYKRISNWAPFF
jgi:hypothetical protein